MIDALIGRSRFGFRELLEQRSRCGVLVLMSENVAFELVDLVLGIGRRVRNMRRFFQRGPGRIPTLAGGEVLRFGQVLRNVFVAYRLFGGGTWQRCAVEDHRCDCGLNGCASCPGHKSPPHTGSWGETGAAERKFDRLRGCPRYHAARVSMSPQITCI